MLRPGIKEPRGRRNCECIVTPPAFSAAMPVGATTTNGLCVRDARFRKNVVFPVPAFPVRKIWVHVLLINRTARSGMLSYSTSEVTGSFLFPDTVSPKSISRCSVQVCETPAVNQIVRLFIRLTLLTVIAKDNCPFAQG